MVRASVFPPLARLPRLAAALVAAMLLGGCEREQPALPAETTGKTATVPGDDLNPKEAALVPRGQLVPHEEATARSEDRRAVRSADEEDDRPAAPSPGSPTPAPPARPDAADGPPPQAAGRISTEYHEKLKALRERYAGNTDDPQFAQEVLELRRWFSSEMREVRMANQAMRKKTP